VRLPARWALVGVLGEPSGFGRATYVWTVRSPLYSPSDVLDLSYSSRVGGGAERLDDADPAAVSAAIGKAVTDIATEDEVLQTWARLSLKTANMRMFETAAYAQILTGDPRSARRTLAAARRLARGKDEPDWVRPVFDRMAQLEQLLDGKATADVMDLLDSWAAQTAAALKVPRGLHLAKS